MTVDRFQFLSVVSGVLALAGCATGNVSSIVPADVAAIELEGDYQGHLQDVWHDGDGHIYWAHTRDLLKTDLTGRILAHATVEGHHAGIEVRDGRVYVAVCPMQSKTKGKTTPDCRVSVGEYDAETLKLIDMHVTDINDRAGSLTILDDGSFLIGCLRPQDIAEDQVRFHHLDRNFRLIRSHVLSNVPVRLGIEVIKRYKDGYLLCLYGADKNKNLLDFDTIRLDSAFREIWRGYLGGACGLIEEENCFWIGKSKRDEKSKRYSSRLRRIGKTLD